MNKFTLSLVVILTSALPVTAAELACKQIQGGCGGGGGHYRASVLDYGAKCDGSTDDASAFQSAATAAAAIQGPPQATCVINSTVTFPSVNGAGFIGAGRSSTVISVNSTTARGFVQSGFTTGPYYANFTLTRSGTATVGATGLDISGSVSFGRIDNILLSNHYLGLALGPTDWSYLTNSIIQNNQNHGIFLTNSASNGAIQWSLDNILSQENGGWGLMSAVTSGPTSVTLGTINRFDTFGNSAGGIAITGGGTAPVNGVRIYNSFLGQDGGDELYMLTGTGGQHVLSNLFLELAGTSPTGPSLGTSATGVGNGINIVSAKDVQIENPHINQMSNHGIISTASQLSVVGGEITNNGASSGSGIVINATGNILITGVKSINTAGSSQTYGIYLGAYGISGVISNNNIAGNSSGGLYNASSGGPLITTSNIGYNPVGAATLSPGASPWSYTCGTSPETLYFSASTALTGFTQGGINISLGATPPAWVTLECGSNETVIIGYTGTLTGKVMRH